MGSAHPTAHRLPAKGYQKWAATTFGEAGAFAITCMRNTSCRFSCCHPAGASRSAPARELFLGAPPAPSQLNRNAAPILTLAHNPVQLHR